MVAHAACLAKGKAVNVIVIIIVIFLIVIIGQVVIIDIFILTIGFIRGVVRGKLLENIPAGNGRGVRA